MDFEDSRMKARLFVASFILLTLCAALATTQTGKYLPGLPSWFQNLDTDADGQVTLSEWREGGKDLDEFRKYDQDDDGFITMDEALCVSKKPLKLQFEKGKAIYEGAIEATDGKYRGQKIAKILTVKLQQGQVYQIDHRSRAFDAYLYLEDPEGNVLAEDDDGGGNLNSRIIHEAAKTGNYRLIATSLGGGGLGPFALSVRIKVDATPSTGLPPWFKALDKNKDGQVSLYEWRQGGKTLEQFREYDLNDDGFITADELLGIMQKPITLKLVNGQATYDGAIEAADEKYRGQKSPRSSWSSCREDKPTKSTT